MKKTLNKGYVRIYKANQLPDHCRKCAGEVEDCVAQHRCVTYGTLSRGVVCKDCGMFYGRPGITRYEIENNETLDTQMFEGFSDDVVWST